MFYLHFNAFWLAVVDYLFDCLSYLFDSFDYLFDGFDYLFDGLSYLFDSFRYLFDGYDVTPTNINIYQIRKVDDNKQLFDPISRILLFIQARWLISGENEGRVRYHICEPE